MTPPRVMSGGAHLRSLAPGQLSYEETLQQWQAISDAVSDLSEPGIEPQTYRTNSARLTTVLITRFIKSSSYSRYYAESCNEWRGPSLRFSAWATQL